MITPKLEKLIWEGKAFFKTFVASQAKSTLNIDNDRFIIITDIQFHGFVDLVGNLDAINMQMNIYGEKGFNHYIFRNQKPYPWYYYDPAEGISSVPSYQLCDPQTINTYLLHSTQVGFSFLKLGQVNNGANIVSSVSNPSYAPPLDYGKDGDIGAIPTIQSTFDAVMTNFLNNRQGFVLPDGVVTTQQLQFGATLATRPQTSGAGFVYANINYIEILGQPENMQF